MKQEWRTRGDEDVGGGGGVGAVGGGGGQYPQKEESGECSTGTHRIVSIDGEIFKIESAQGIRIPSDDCVQRECFMA